MCAFITGIGTANPKHKISQQDILSFMVKAHELKDEPARKLNVLYRATGIQYRYSVLEDYQNPDSYSFFPNQENLEPFPDTNVRSDLYQKEALNLSIAAVNDCLPAGFDRDKITHLITVSCTGMYAPGLDIEMVETLKLRSNIERTAINFMGCYAAFNAMKVARSICNSAEANVLVVCTELCSIHFQKENTENNYLANALFGDGSAALLVQSKSSSSISLSMERFQCDLLPQGKEEMAWKIGNFGFEMKLSAYVPDMIKKGIPALLQKLFAETKTESFDFYAIHPGGKKILSTIEELLHIDAVANTYSHHVLKNYGNMSSPTILFVLKAIWNDLKDADRDKQVLSLAFGPGLTLESMVLKVV